MAVPRITEESTALNIPTKKFQFEDFAGRKMGQGPEGVEWKDLPDTYLPSLSIRTQPELEWSRDIRSTYCSLV